jgi:hypothetical protein
VPVQKPGVFGWPYDRVPWKNNVMMKCFESVSCSLRTDLYRRSSREKIFVGFLVHQSPKVTGVIADVSHTLLPFLQFSFDMYAVESTAITYIS